MISRRIGLLGSLVVLIMALELFASAGTLGIALSGARLGSGAPLVSPPLASQTPLNLNITLSGAGATFPAPLIFNLTSEYHLTHPNVTITYGAFGSGAGQSAALNKTTDFGQSDAPLSTRQRALFPGILHIPDTIGSIVLAYNLPGIPRGGLNLTGPAVANIYLGVITNWNDSAIRALNPGLVRTNSLPNHTILTVHRQDSSGTTFVFTSYLCEESFTWFHTVGNGTLVTWPVGVAAAQNIGVANYVNSTAYGFGYVELQYALKGLNGVGGGLTYAYLQNNSGTYILDDLQTTQNAVANAAGTLPAASGDWSHVSLLNEPGAQSYPIASFSYLLAYTEMNVVPSMDLVDHVKFSVLKDFLNWVITTGQNFAPGNNYVALPVSVVTIDQTGISSMKYSEVSTPVTRNISLSIGASGFNGTQPGPSITVVTGDTVNLKLNNLDGASHQWYIDFNNDTIQDGNETYITCSTATPGVTTCPPFSPVIWNTRSVPHEGAFNYRDSSSGATGSITILPQQAAAVFETPKRVVDVNNAALPTLDSTRVATVGTLIIDLRTDLISQNVTIVASDKSTAAITYSHTYQIPNLQLGTVSGVTGLAVRFVLNVAVGPYALSSNVLVQLSLVPVCRSAYATSPAVAFECRQALTSFSLTRELDMNNHGVVDIADVTTVLGAYGTTIGGPGYNPLADLNASGVITITGLGPLFANYGYKVFYT